MRSRDDWADAMYDVSWGVDGNRTTGSKYCFGNCAVRDAWADDMYDVSCAVDVLWMGIAR
eukprot:265011-Hanusia_phi.AAC.1